MENNKVEIYSESIKDTIIYDKFLGTIKTKKDNILYSRKEVKLLIDQDKKTGLKVTMNQHLVKKVFSGELVEYVSKKKIISSKNQIRKNRKKSWDQISSD